MFQNSFALVLIATSIISTSAFAQGNPEDEIASVRVTDITESAKFLEKDVGAECIIDCGPNTKPGTGNVAPTTPTPFNTGIPGAVPTATPIGPVGPGGITGVPSPTPFGGIFTPGYPGTGTTPLDVGGFIPGPTGAAINQLLIIGARTWDFILSSKPQATYNTLRASVVPSGISSWAQLSGWSKPQTKVYHVEFLNVFGKPAGSFDYRIGFIYGGSYKTKGKFIGQISFAPDNIKLKTDRSLNLKAEILEPLNFGTEEDPVAGVQLLISYNSPTTTRYEMHSVEYFLYGTGEVLDMTNGLH